MRHHLLAWGKVALDASAGDVQLIAVPEQVFSQDAANNFNMPINMVCISAYAGGIGLTRARFNTGSLRARGFPQIVPFALTTLDPTPPNEMDMTRWPLPLARDESVRIDVTNGAANDVVALARVTPEAINYNINTPGLRWLRFTCTTTGVALAWSAPVAMTLIDTLEGGFYDVYGMIYQATTCIAARLIFQGEFYRPGVLGQALNTAVPPDLNQGRLGKWASFNTYSPPQLETLNSAAGASVAQGWLLCGKSMAA